MIILGLSAPFGHDASAALLQDGHLIAAAEEERFTRRKHAKDQIPVNAARFCFKQAGVKAAEVDAVAFPWSARAIDSSRWVYAARNFFTNPSRAYKKFFGVGKEERGQTQFLQETMRVLGLDEKRTQVHWVEHHLAHAASAFYFSGYGKAAVLSLDGGGETVSTLVARADETGIHKIKEFVLPDSLGHFYATMTDYLGFDREDGQYKVMGMAAYGDARRINLDRLISWDARSKSFRCNDEYIGVTRDKRYRMDKMYSKRMVADLGPPRTQDDLSEPYVHIAAATQAKLEEIVFHLIDDYLKDELKEHKSLCLAGGCALNVVLNGKLAQYPLIRRLWVQPAANDAGGALGAAAWVAAQGRKHIEPMLHAYWGPEFTNAEIESVLKTFSFSYERVGNISERAADLLARGEVVGWFQGRAEWGPRALGHRSILGHPAIEGMTDRINGQVKDRESWRPFCPSILAEYATDILGSDSPAPFMTQTFDVAPHWKSRIPAVVHIDGTCRPQIVDEKIDPKFHQLIKSFYQKTKLPVVLNTSFNRKGEPIVNTPYDAVCAWEGCAMNYLAIGDFLVSKSV